MVENRSTYLNTRLASQAPLQLRQRTADLVANTRLALVVRDWCRSGAASGVVAGRGVVSAVRGSHGTSTTVTVVSDAFGVRLGCASSGARASEWVGG